MSTPFFRMLAGPTASDETRARIHSALVLRENFQRFLTTQGYSTPPGRSVCALNSARTLIQFRSLESADLVRLRAEHEQENYFDVYGKPDDEKEYKAICDAIDRNGCYCVISEFFDGQAWQRADSIGMCAGYDNPLDPFQNDYVISLMARAVELIPQPGDH